ncbi:hypothetical protein BT67DRAFT_451904 [Trichocladium antarcticum]|uniref:Meiotically up-regulated 65 protein n=1 Tax=Trichocladium antarcticum TaxID=1450529 RepID=A0AAN6UEH5_9PEZI|nr:hypothetical protein BT67DRAFT_451904 [Trichocladium antarcticum]
MRRIRHRRSSRRAPLPKDSDFDHEISLVDHDEEESTLGLSSAGPSASQRDPPSAADSAAPRAADGDGGSGGERGGERGGEQGPRQPCVRVEEPTPQGDAEHARRETPTTAKSRESVIDILYENQRGGFLCGVPLFSAKALGNLDPAPWTNYVHKVSRTDIHTAQVPDPSWEWAWPEWRINHDDGTDEDGWKYSFAFWRKFPWRRARWWRSFVRRRAWIRKRVKKKSDCYLGQDPHMLGPDYFSVRSSSEAARDRSPSRASSASSAGGSRRQSMSTANLSGGEQPAIEHADELLRVLRVSRIDREKIEAVDNYLDHAQEDLGGLQEIMHDIMSLFVFQASRRVLLTRLTEAYDGMAARQKTGEGTRAKNLAAAVQHADEEVRRLEYWSDVKGLAEEGGSKGAVDHKQGWDPAWQGVDKSGPAAPRAHRPARETGEPGPGPGAAA